MGEEIRRVSLIHEVSACVPAALKEPFLDGPLHEKLLHDYRSRLSDSVNSVDQLQFCSLIPLQLDEEAMVGACECEASGALLHREQENEAAWIRTKSPYLRVELLVGVRATDASDRIAIVALRQTGEQKAERILPRRENNHLRPALCSLAGKGVDARDDGVELGAEACACGGADGFNGAGEQACMSLACQ